MEKPITIKNIAKQANVSLSTVSRALQNKAGISERKREEIKQLAKEMGYQPDVIAQSMKGQKLKMIGVLIPDNTNPYYAGLLKCVEATARDKDYNIIIINTNEQSGIELEAISALNSLRVAGILAAPVEQANYGNIVKPLIFISRCNISQDRFNYIVNDDLKGGYLATTHLIERGYKELIFFCGGSSLDISNYRLEGFKKALADHGLPHKQENVFLDTITIEDGYNAFMKLILRRRPPFGIFCMSDHISLGVLHGIFESGLELVKDVGVVGYDDIEMASYLEHPLTTVRQAKFDISKLSTEILIDMIENPGQIKEKIQRVIQPQLIIRATT